MGEWLQALLPAAFFGWLFWALFLRNKQGADDQVPDRPDQPYSIYTTAFDHELDADAVASELAASSVRCGMPNAVEVPDLAQRNVLADQAFNSAIASNGAAAARAALAECKSTASVCVLIDQSGSMVNRTPELVGQLRALEQIFSETDHEFGLFGFTTMGWHGGMARDAWKKAGRPNYPGRLCSLLHIVYKPFDLPIPESHWQVLLNPGFFFENVDGEALEWGRRLLTARPAANKLLIVVSDGAPVDDATLMANGPGILERHILQVIAAISADPTLKLGAIGMGFEVDRYYPISTRAERPEGFLGKFSELLKEMVPNGSA